MKINGMKSDISSFGEVSSLTRTKKGNFLIIVFFMMKE